MPVSRPALERFEEKYVKQEGACWIWTASTDQHGYGKFAPERTHLVPAHRYSYELHVGPIPDGLELDHLCMTKLCVNPAHLEPVTHLENVRRALPFRPPRKSTHCKRGHPYSGPNLQITSRGFRQCRTCRQASGRRQVQRISEARKQRRELLLTHSAIRKYRCESGIAYEESTGQSIFLLPPTRGD